MDRRTGGRDWDERKSSAADAKREGMTTEVQTANESERRGCLGRQCSCLIKASLLNNTTKLTD